MMFPRSFLLFSAALSAIVVFGLSYARWNGSEMRRPLQCDEFITVNYYTWAGLTASGEHHPLRRAEDYRVLPRVEGRQLGMGIYRSLGVWTEPNNHVFHSLLVNFAIAPGKPDERTVRIPAFLGALAASIFAFWVCRQSLGWTAAAPLIATAIFCLPYMVQFSQEARGYSWMIALLFLQFGSMYQLAYRPDSIVWGAACVFTSILTFINVVSTALDWLLPLYLAFMFYPPIPAGEEPFSSEKKRIWRRNLLVQLLALGSVGMVFLIDRLPAVYSSMHQYGIPFTGFAEYLPLILRMIQYLFPGPLWTIVAALGVAGILMMLFSCSHRPLAAVILFTLTINLSHFWLAKKFPYERVCGYLAPLAIFGTGYLVEIVLARMQSAGWRYALYAGFSAATVGLAFLSLTVPIASDNRMVAIPQLIAAQEELAQTPGYAVLPAGSESLRPILPKSWIDPTDSLPNKGEVNLVCCLVGQGKPSLLMEDGVNERRTLRRLNHSPRYQTSLASSTCYLAWQRMRVQPLRPDTAVPSSIPYVIVWQPAPDRLGLDGSSVRAHIARFDVPYLQHNARIPAKLSFFNRLAALEFLPQSIADAEKTIMMVQEGMRRFGGSAWLFQSCEGSGE